MMGELVVGKTSCRRVEQLENALDDARFLTMARIMEVELGSKFRCFNLSYHHDLNNTNRKSDIRSQLSLDKYYAVRCSSLFDESASTEQRPGKDYVGQDPPTVSADLNKLLVVLNTEIVLSYGR